MMKRKSKIFVLSGNALKIIAASLMLTDHIGYILFPQYKIFRIIGRMSFPVFAFMIAEGCYHTRNKLKYFLTVFCLAVACQVVYYFFNDSLDMGVLVTFSLSILMVYSLEYFKEKLLTPDISWSNKLAAFEVFAFVVVFVYILNIYLNIDYGFWGCITPVFSSAFRRTKRNPADLLKKLDCLPVHVFMTGISLVILSVAIGGIQFYCLLSLPLILMYSGRKGKTNLKTFFYVFYPVHLAALHVIAILCPN